MAYRTHCAWCGAWLARDADYAEMSGTIHHRKGKSALDAKWAEEPCITRHFCASPREDTDRGGRNRAGLVPEDSFDRCYDRAIAAIEGTKLSDPGMGMEWRLMPVGDNESPPTAATSDPGTYREDDRDLSMYHVGAVDTDRGLSYGTRSVLSNAG